MTGQLGFRDKWMGSISAISPCTPIPTTPPFRPLKNSRIPDRSSYLPTFYSTNFDPNCFETWILFFKLVMPRYTEDDLAQAIEDIANGKFVRRAAREWGIPYGTLRDRIEGSENHSSAAESQQRLSKVQEDYLT